VAIGGLPVTVSSARSWMVKRLLFDRVNRTRNANWLGPEEGFWLVCGTASKKAVGAGQLVPARNDGDQA